MIQFSCADFTFPLMERAAALRLIRLLGFSHVDLGLFARSDHFSPLALQESPRGYTTRVTQDLQASELRVSDVFLQIGVDPVECSANDPDARRRQLNRETFLRSIEFCVALGCSHLTGLPGMVHSQASRERDVAVAAEEALWRVAACTRAGLQYAIEPHVGSLCPNVATTAAFLQRVPGLTLTLDYGHFVMAEEPSDRVHSLLGFASHIHVRGGAPGRLQTSVKDNTIDFAEMASRLQSLDYRGFLALEYVWIDWNGCNCTDNVSETLLLRRALESALQP